MVGADVTLGLTIATLAGFTILGVWYAHGRIETVEDLITARNTTGEGLTAATIIATGMGAWMLFTPAEAGATFGGIAALFGYTVGAVLGSIVYIPIAARIRRAIPAGHTLTEFVYVRFGAAMYVYVLAITFGYLFLVLSSGMTGITAVLSIVGGVPEWQTALLIGTFVLAYTAYGGLVASIFTDAIQTLLILPLLAVSFVTTMVALGGAGEVYGQVAAVQPQLLDPFFLPGLEFGLYSSMGIVAVTIFHQGYWQRVYAAADERVVKRSFGLAAIASVPMVVLPGVFGLAAVGLGLVETSADGSVALFLVLEAALPDWVTLGVILLAVLLIMSTADTLFNAIASIVVADLPLLLDGLGEEHLTALGRTVTVLAGLGAIVVGLQGYSVLELLLLANLLATATVLPFLAGLYSGRTTGRHALAASLVGLIGGILLFPITNEILLERLGDIAVLPETSFLFAYLTAAVLSGGCTLAMGLLAPGAFDLNRLKTEIRTLDEGGERA